MMNWKSQRVYSFSANRAFHKLRFLTPYDIPNYLTHIAEVWVGTGWSGTYNLMAVEWINECSGFPKGANTPKNHFIMVSDLIWTCCWTCSSCSPCVCGPSDPDDPSSCRGAAAVYFGSVLCLLLESITHGRGSVVFPGSNSWRWALTLQPLLFFV